MNKRSL